MYFDTYYLNFRTDGTHMHWDVVSCRTFVIYLVHEMKLVIVIAAFYSSLVDWAFLNIATYCGMIKCFWTTCTTLTRRVGSELLSRFSSLRWDFVYFIHLRQLLRDPRARIGWWHFISLVRYYTDNDNRVKWKCHDISYFRKLYMIFAFIM